MNTTCPCCKGTGQVSQAVGLRMRRIAAGVPLKQMAARCGFSQSYLSMLESDGRPIPPKVKEEYAKL